MKHAFRSLAKSPGFALTAAVTLALGIGASTAIFSVVHALLLSPLQYRAADQLVEVQSRHPKQGSSGLAPATFLDVASASRSFVNLAAQYYYYLNLTGTDTPTLLNSADVTSEFFNVFGVAPLRGRTWIPDDFKPSAPPVVVLSYELWRRQFNARESIIGQTIMLDDVAHVVVGVMPATFKDPRETAQLWRPMRPGADDLTNRSSRYWTAFGRLVPDVSLKRANDELAIVFRHLTEAHPRNYEGWKIEALDLRSIVVGDYRTALLTALGAVGCVMLITCANLAGLSLVRAATRRKELAIRSALGSSRLQLVFLLLGENVLLAVAGGIVGVMLASWGIDALLAILPSGWLPRSDEITLNFPVLAGTSALTILTGTIAGLAPGLIASRTDAADALKDKARGSAGPASRRLRSGLVVAEIALALALLAATGILGRSFAGLLQRKAGLDASRVLSLTLSLSGKRYDSPAKCWGFFSRAETEVAALTSVEAAGFTQTSPFRWGIPVGYVPLFSDDLKRLQDWPQAFTDSVSVDYFKALGIPLRAGRLFTPSDDYKAPPRMILNETAARRYFGTENPLGRSISSGSGTESQFEVIGIVGDVRRSGLTTDAPLQVYRPLAQRSPQFATLMVRTTLPPATLAKTVQTALWRIDPDLPISDVATMETFVNRSITQPRLSLVLFSLFAVLALLLAALGLYGLIAYSVAQRTREFGIRSALGASPRSILSLVLREGATPVALGLAGGIAGSFAAVRLLQHLVFDTSLHDPVVFISAPLALTAVAAIACLLPARRATKVDPMVALREE